MTEVVVDTTVFVDFFRGRDDRVFKQLLLNNQILLSRYVRLELLQGVRRSEVYILESVLGGLKTVATPIGLFEETEKLLKSIRGSGLTVGIVDLLIAGEARLFGYPIYSLDRVFSKLSSLGLVNCFVPGT